MRSVMPCGGSSRGPRRALACPRSAPSMFVPIAATGTDPFAERSMHKHRPHHIAPAVESARVVLAYKNFAAPGQGSLVGLGVSSMMTAKVLRKSGIWAELWGVRSAQQLGDRLHHAHCKADHQGQADPTHVVIAAPWIPTCELEVLASEWPEIVFTVVSHSNWAFLQADPGAVRLLREAARLHHMTHNIGVGG